MTVFAGYDTDEEISFDIIGNLCRVRQAQSLLPTYKLICMSSPKVFERVKVSCTQAGHDAI